MSELQVQRTPQLIAAEINAIHSQTQRMVLYNSIEIGRRLVEAKSLLNHGEWTGWLKDSVDYSQSTANNFMRIFQEYGADQISLLAENNTKSTIYDRITYSQAVALLALPGEEREGFIESHDIEEMSTRQLQEAIKERDKLRDEKEKTEAEVLAKEEVLRETQAELETQRHNYIEKINDLLSQKDKEKENELERQRKASEEKINELKEKMRNLENAANQEPEQEKYDIEEEREKIRTELQDEMARNMEREKAKLQAEIDQAQRELESKEKKIKDLQATGSNEETQRFKVMFEQTVESFKKLLSQVSKIKASDEETGMKYAGAVEKALLAMTEEIKKQM